MYVSPGVVVAPPLYGGGYYGGYGYGGYGYGGVMPAVVPVGPAFFWGAFDGIFSVLPLLLSIAAFAFAITAFVPGPEQRQWDDEDEL